MVNMSVGECSCNSRAASEGSESTLFLIVACLHSPSVPQTYCRTKSLIKGRETQPSLEADNDVC